MKLKYEGKLTAGRCDDMECGFPIFIDKTSLSHVVKKLLVSAGLNGVFCCRPWEEDEDVDNPLIGKKVRLTLEIEMDETG